MVGTLAIPLIHSFARGGGRHQGSLIHTLARWYTLRDEKNDSPLHSQKMLHLARWRNQIGETFTHLLTTILMEIILTLLHWVRLYSLRSWVDTVPHTLTRWCTHTEKRAHSPMQWLSCLLRCYLLHTDVSPFMQTGSLNRPCSHAYIHMVVTLAGTLLLSFTSSYSRGCTHSHAHLYHFCAKLHFQHSVQRRGAEWIHACVYQV